MLLHFRNTYKTRKIMLWYALISILSMTLGICTLALLFLFPFWWLYFITIVLFLLFFFTFFLLVLENNNYNIKYYYSREKFKELYNGLIDKYKITNRKYERKLKKVTKDLFYQFGSIDETNIELRLLAFDNWLENQSKMTVKELNDDNQLDFFLYLLLAGTTNSSAFKIYLKSLSNVYNREQFDKMLSACSFIKEEFKEKCLFIYDNPSFISESLLDTMYMESLLIVQGIIGILSFEVFESILYNPHFYYSEDKRIAYTVVEENGLHNVYEKNIGDDSVARLEEQCKNIDDALRVVDENLKMYEKRKGE